MNFLLKFHSLKRRKKMNDKKKPLSEGDFRKGGTNSFPTRPKPPIKPKPQSPKKK